MTRKGLLIVLSGPSGTGKGTVCKKFLAQCDNIAYSISATTRAPRPGEVNGREYLFLSKDEFQSMIDHDELLEWANVYGNFYGTPLGRVKKMREEGCDVLLEIDTQGALDIMRRSDIDAIYIFMLPPSLSELERRIVGRGTETPESLKRRLDNAVLEIDYGKKYDYVVVNDEVDAAASKLCTIIQAERQKAENNLALFEKIKSGETI